MPELDPNSDPPLSRVELLRLAQGLGVVDADVMTRAELRAAIGKAQRPERPALDQHPITWVSVARRLLASVVERGLNLPDAAALIRGDAKLMAPPMAPPPVATVTLARIYAAQGHLDRAIGTLDEVIDSDPDHELARGLRGQLDLRRAELAQREGAAEASAPDEGERAALRASNGHGLSPASEPPPPPLDIEAASSLTPPPTTELASLLGTDADSPAPAEVSQSTPADGDALSAEPPPVASVDAAAELVAPSFDTVERQAAHADLSPFPSEPPTLVGIVALDLETPAAPNVDASDPPATIAAGVDWQIENDSAASAAVTPEVDGSVWASSAAAASDIVEASHTSAAAAASADTVSAADTADTASTADTVSADAFAGDSLATLAAPANEPSPAPPAVTIGAEADPIANPEPSVVSSHALNGISNGVAPAAVGEPAGADSAAASPAPAAPPPPAAPAEPLPSVPGLLLIETDTPVRYIYWELVAAGSPHWIHVVTHTPTGRGDTERRERRFAVHRPLGALRLEGVPCQAVVRAKLTHTPDDARPLVVAGAVRPCTLAGSASFEVRFAPYGKGTPEALAGRAQALLERASRVDWDS